VSLFIARSCFLSYYISEAFPFAIPVYAAVMEMYFPEENTIIIFIILASSSEINESLEQCLPQKNFSLKIFKNLNFRILLITLNFNR